MNGDCTRSKLIIPQPVFNIDRQSWHQIKDWTLLFNLLFKYLNLLVRIFMHIHEYSLTL